MIDRTSLVTISFVVLLVHLLSCSGAPADASSLHFGKEKQKINIVV